MLAPPWSWRTPLWEILDPPLNCHGLVFELVDQYVRTFSWDVSSVFLMELPATRAKYEITFLVFSVFPAPDSPLA